MIKVDTNTCQSEITQSAESLKTVFSQGIKNNEENHFHLSLGIFLCLSLFFFGLAIVQE